MAVLDSYQRMHLLHAGNSPYSATFGSIFGRPFTKALASLAATIELGPYQRLADQMRAQQSDNAAMTPTSKYDPIRAGAMLESGDMFAKRTEADTAPELNNDASHPQLQTENAWQPPTPGGGAAPAA